MSNVYWQFVPQMRSSKSKRSLAKLGYSFRLNEIAFICRSECGTTLIGANSLINVTQSTMIRDLKANLNKIFFITFDKYVGNFSVDDVKTKNIEEIDKCIRNLKSGKACGLDEPDGCGEHLLNIFNMLIPLLRNAQKRFTVMINYGLAPTGFGRGIVVPLVKDKTGDIHSANNYRNVTLVPIISKLFEAVILECYGIVV